MRLLLDTCTFLWLIRDDRLPVPVVEQIIKPENNIYLSVVSAWEMGIKYSLGRLPFPTDPLRYVRSQREKHQIDSLALTEEEALNAHRLPKIHSDPFDRMLVAQALVGGLTLLTPDPFIRQYPVKTLWQD